MKIKIRTATFDEHKDICKIAKQSKYTKDFSNMIFSAETCYQEGRITIALVGKRIVGFYTIRNRKRDGVTVLYFVGVEDSRRGNGIGTRLMEDLHSHSTGVVELKVMKDNPAVNLYQRLGYQTIGEVYEGKGLLMKWESPD